MILGIVVPYRNRQEHLDQFLPYIKDYLIDVPHEIIIVEQVDGKYFNRGKLMNIGFSYTKDKFDYYCFHDVDLLPEKADYSLCENPTHLSKYVEQFNWKPIYETIFGGVTLFDKDSFEKINGYSNEYWGWGAEDDDLYLRCTTFDLEISRREGRFFSLPHEASDRSNYNNTINTFNQNKINLSQDMCLSDGLSTLSYTLIKEDEENYIHLVVDI